MGSGENSLGLFTLCSESSQGSSITGDVNASLLFELSDAIVHKHVVEIFSAQVGVSIGGFDFENTIFNTEKGYIESATTKIKDKNISFTLVFFVEPISDGSSSWLINDSLNIHA